MGNPPKATGNNAATVASLPAKASSPAPSPVVSADVVHLHRLGSCQGRLAVTPNGVSFVTKEKGGEDSFTLKYAEFLHALEDDALILKTGTKTYRFKDEESRTRNGAGLRDVANRITRARR